MRSKLILALLVAFLSGCSDNRQNKIAEVTTESIVTIDTIVGSKIITNEIAGSSFRKRATGYFVITGKDTSNFTCVFVELKDSGKVCIDLNFPYPKDGITYRQRMRELQRILPLAAKDFNFDLLRSVYIGRLVQNGDIAIEISKQYAQKIGPPQKITDYNKVELFLKESQLGLDFSEIFRPYSITVENVASEKLAFYPKKELYFMSKVEADTAEVPEKILDCMTWIMLKKI